MKTRSTLIAVLSVLGLTIGAAAQAEVVTNVKVPIAPFTVFVPCANGGAGELVDFTGDLHVLVSSTINGNHVSGKLQVQPQGVGGVGLVTGDKYRATGLTQETFSFDLSNGQGSDTFVNNFRMIGAGPGNNFLVHETLHLTINASGSVTVFFDNFSIGCK